MRRALAALALLVCVPAGAVPPRSPADTLREDANPDNERRIQRELQRDGGVELPDEAPIPTPRPESDPLPGGADARVRPRQRPVRQPATRAATQPPPQQQLPAAGRTPADSVPLSGPQEAPAAGTGAMDSGAAGTGGNASTGGDGGSAGKGKTATSRVDRGLESMKRSLGEMRGDAGALEGAASATAGAALAAAAEGQAAARVAAAAPAPRALDKRPDFFSVLPPSKLKQLQSVFSAPEGPALPSFKHLGLSAAGDFSYTASCQRVSGECNPRAVEPGYKKGELASPETLASVHKGAEEEVDGTALARFFAEEDAEEEAAVAAWEAKQARPRKAVAPRGVSWESHVMSLFSPKEDDGMAVSAVASASGGALERPGFEYSAAPRPRRAGAPRVASADEPAPARGFPWPKLALAALGAAALLAARRWLAQRDAARVELTPLGRDDA